MKLRRLVLFIFAIMAFPLGALAQDLHEPHIGTASDCPAVWHFIHNQIPGAEQGTLTAQFQNAGTVTVSANKVLKNTQHYDVVLDSADVLLGASDDIEGGKLVLSHVECVETQTTTTTAPPETTSTTTSTTVPESTTTTVPGTSTTTTTVPESTTTTAPEETSTTSTVPGTSTTTVPDTTSTTLTTSTLPETGVSTGLLAGIGLAALAAGTGLVLLTRYAKES